MPQAVPNPCILPCPSRVVLAFVPAHAQRVARTVPCPKAIHHSGGDQMQAQASQGPDPSRSDYLSRRTALLSGGASALVAMLAARGLALAQGATPAAAELLVESLGAGLPVATPGRQLILARV